MIGREAMKTALALSFAATVVVGGWLREDEGDPCGAVEAIGAGSGSCPEPFAFVASTSEFRVGPAKVIASDRDDRHVRRDASGLRDRLGPGDAVLCSDGRQRL